MPNYVPIRKDHYRTLGWQTRSGYRFASTLTTVPLLLRELGSTLQYMPAAFIEQNQRYRLVGMLALEQGNNLFVHPDGRWFGNYVPMALRHYPFHVALDASGGAVACIDEQSELIQPRDTAEFAFFNDDDTPTEALDTQLQTLRKYSQQQQITQRAVDALADAGLIQPWPLSIQQGDTDAKKATGFFRVDEHALGHASGDTLLALRDSGGLALAYAQLYAQHRIKNLSHLSRLQSSMAAHEQAPEPDLEELFGDDDEDLLFDFDQ